MNKKYQISENGKNHTFNKKNDFIDYCQIKHNESFSRKNKNKVAFSFNGGIDWYDIIYFKEFRQTIQNEKSSNTRVNSESSNTQVNSKQNQESSWLGNLVIILAIVGGIYIFNNNESQSNSSDKSTQLNDREVATNGNSENNEDDFISSVSITEYARNVYNESPILQAINASENEKKWILAILSDPNPNPNGQQGNSCGQNNYRCKYCSNYIPSRFFTLQQRLDDLTNSSLAFGYGIATEYNLAATMKNNISKESQSSGSELDKAIENGFDEKIQEGYSVIKGIINEYKNGERYCCLAQPIDGSFCSEKCKIEYKLNN